MTILAAPVLSLFAVGVHYEALVFASAFVNRVARTARVAVALAEVAVVTQGQSLDEVVANLNEAVALHLQDEDPAEFGLSAAPRLAVSYETPVAGR